MSFFEDSFSVVCSYGLPSSLEKISEPLIWSQRLRAAVCFSCRYTHFVTREYFGSSSFWLSLLATIGMEPLPLRVSCRRAVVALILLDFIPNVESLLCLWEEKGATLTRNLVSAVHRWVSGWMRNVYPLFQKQNAQSHTTRPVMIPLCFDATQWAKLSSLLACPLLNLECGSFCCCPQWSWLENVLVLLLWLYIKSQSWVCGCNWFENLGHSPASYP